MGILTCSRCGAKTKADSIEEGRIRLDHAIGLVKGKPCEDGKAELFLTGKTKKKPSLQETPKESVKDTVKKVFDTTRKSFFNKD